MRGQILNGRTRHLLLSAAAAVFVAMASAAGLSRAEGPGQSAALLSRVSGDEDLRAFQAWARSRLIPLPQALERDNLTKLTQGARLIAIGEMTHGAHQPLEFRNQIVRALIQAGKITAVGLEIGFSEARRVDAYVAGGEGEVARIVRENFSWGFGEFQENVELVRWIRDYNANPAHVRKIRIYGLDVPGGSTAGGLENAGLVLTDVAAALDAHDRARCRIGASRLAGFKHHFTPDHFARLSSEHRTALRDAIAAAIACARTLPGSAASGYAGDPDIALRSAQLAQSLFRMFVTWPADAANGLTAAFYDSADAREAAMAENTLWALNREGSDGGILMFAHNGHVMNAPLKGGIWDIYPRPLMSAGQRLRARLGRTMRIIGTSSAAAVEGLPRRESPVPTLDTDLASLDGSPFILEIGDKADASRWLWEERQLASNVTTEFLIIPSIAFDAIAYLGTLTPATGEHKLGPM